MKKIILATFVVLLLNSCKSSEEQWHENTRILGAKSLYIHKDGAKTTGEEWYANHKEEDKKFKEKYSNAPQKSSTQSSQVFIGVEQ